MADPAMTGAMNAKVMTSRRRTFEVKGEIRCMVPLSLLVRNIIFTPDRSNGEIAAYAIATRLSSPVNPIATCRSNGVRRRFFQAINTAPHGISCSEQSRRRA
jgi:hypothetical protein